MTGPYAAFIVSSYAIALIVVGLLVAWVAIDLRAQRRALRDLEASGVTRRAPPHRSGV